MSRDALYVVVIGLVILVTVIFVAPGIGFETTAGAPFRQHDAALAGRKFL